LRFQFSIRSLLVLTLAVAVPYSWLGVKLKVAAIQQQTVAGIVKLGGSAGYDYELDASGRFTKATPPQPEWLEELLGPDFFSNVVSVKLDDPQMTDAGLGSLRGLRQLRWLDLKSTQVTDAGLEALKHLDQLNGLAVAFTQITDSGLIHLNGLNRLRWLFLTGTYVTDSGLKHLAGLSDLEKLYLEQTKVTDEGVKNLQQALPNCKITR
jgi:hypothetical protein